MSNPRSSNMSRLDQPPTEIRWKIIGNVIEEWPSESGICDILSLSTASERSARMIQDKLKTSRHCSSMAGRDTLDSLIREMDHIQALPAKPANQIQFGWKQFFVNNWSDYRVSMFCPILSRQFTTVEPGYPRRL